MYRHLSTKFGAFPSEFKGDIRNSSKHVLALCCQAYLLVQNNLLLQ